MHLPPTDDFRADFERRGFVLVQGMFTRHQQSRLLAETRELLRCHATVIDRPDRGLHYRVVTGDRIHTSGPSLFRLYVDPNLIAWIRTVTNTPSLDRSDHLRSAININCLSEAGQQYPWHRDAVPYTSLLFLTTVPRADGGALLIRSADGEEACIQPRAGDWLLMDGARCPHCVEPLRRSTLRLTCPMVYPAVVMPRPAGLDHYLYGSSSADVSARTDQV